MSRSARGWLSVLITGFVLFNYGETYQAGAESQYSSLEDVADLLQPGDVVEIDGGATYYASGAYEAGSDPVIKRRNNRVMSNTCFHSGGDDRFSVNGRKLIPAETASGIMFIRRMRNNQKVVLVNPMKQ